MKRCHLLCLVFGVAIGLCGCEAPQPKEPANAGAFTSYEELRPAEIFRKLSYNPGVDIRDCTRVRVSEIAVIRPVEQAWKESSLRGGTNLAFMVGSLRERLHQELGRYYRVLPDDSFIDQRPEDTLVLKVLVTRLSVVKLPRDKAPPAGITLVPPEAAIEIGCWRGRSRTPFLKIKDWRAGRQVVGEPGHQRGRFGAVLTIYRFWGKRLAELLQTARTNPSAIR